MVVLPDDVFGTHRVGVEQLEMADAAARQIGNEPGAAASADDRDGRVLQSIDIVSVESESRLPSAPPRMNTFMAVDHFLSA